MILSESHEHCTYVRWRNCKREVCKTTRKLYHLRCDSCNTTFYRTSKQFNAKSAAHVCGDCDQKKFAQKQSSVLRQYNKWDASSSNPI